jgi:oxepin-CoA hydrolase/3-oxo-5,6-dehydrosuberyl-CoA semialdehyde dehydrogenase
MQRIAVQASPDQLTAIGGRWVTGARRDDDGAHPFRKSLAALHIGDSITAGPHAVTLEDIEHFAEFTGDLLRPHGRGSRCRQPVVRRPRRTRLPYRCLAAGLFVDPAPGPVLANYGVDNLRFLTPVKPGEELTVTLTVQADQPARRR